MREEKPLSEKIADYEGGDYFVTAAIWRTTMDGELYDTFEVGIRHKQTGKFTLVQSDFSHQSVQDVANAISMLLADKTQCYTAEWCAEHFK